MFVIEWYATDGNFYATSPQPDHDAAWFQYETLTQDFDIPLPAPHFTPMIHDHETAS